jgi:enoyl-CoA hydratase/carnithine racemase
MLPRLLPIDVAKELTFTGRIVSGSEGSELGLINRTAADPVAAAVEVAGQSSPARQARQSGDAH